MIRSLFDNPRLALVALWNNKLRSVLTMLGVIIGVFSIIVLTGLGQGIKKDIASEINQLGSNIIIVLSGKVQTSQGGFNPAASIGASTLTEDDVEAIKQLPDILEDTPIGLMAAVPTAGDRQGLGTMVLAVEPGFFSYTTAYQLVSGRFFSSEENKQQMKVIVLGKDARTSLFPEDDDTSVLGKSVKLGKEAFTVVGTIESVQTTSVVGNSPISAGIVAVPFKTAKSINANTQIFRIGVKADDDANVEVVAKTVQAKLQELHGADDTTVLTQKDILKVVDNVLSLITKAIVGLASISLVVGGIGIMNIMLVSVTERTKEIGLRKAIGASNSNILFQFLTEAVILSLLGGALGVLLAVAVSIPVHAKAGLTVLITPQAGGLAVLFAFLVGVVFGVAPAIRASRLNPIEALRRE